MGSLRVTLCAIAALGTVAVTPAAYAADGGVAVSPSSPRPGGDIALLVSGCREKTALAVSTAFVADARLTVGTDGTLVGQSRIRSTLTAGTYDVRVACGDTARTGAVTVARKGARPSAHASPVAPVEAGGGGSAHLEGGLSVADARAAGPGTAHTVTGLVLAGVAATAVALRSARRGREQGRPR
ncbi:hypothetical protein [Streptomyces sp. AC550_RSS872]|uniref:hypothetical protein n=1 Tax=Streptomyces sp. AC550_RSS872 TaxID=2823689 RepID=UPI001C26FF07|nr:hypothetical protein [Streptomyces sp. AC550_RSS872]